MADITVEDANLQDLRRRASELASGVESLAALFEQDAIRLRRRDEIERLNALRSSILQQVERATGEEMAARSGYNKARTVSSLFRLGAGLVTMTSENRTMRAISRELLAGSNDREPHYGTVLVRIGPGGVPEDVDVVCISCLARETNREEFGVMNELQKHGCLLFGEKAFSLLIDTLSDEILKGQLNLPLSPERIGQIQVSHPLRLNPQNKD
jgi:hypothetical protein